MLKVWKYLNLLHFNLQVFQWKCVYVCGVYSDSIGKRGADDCTTVSIFITWCCST